MKRPYVNLRVVGQVEGLPEELKKGGSQGYMVAFDDGMHHYPVACGCAS